MRRESCANLCELGGELSRIRRESARTRRELARTLRESANLLRMRLPTRCELVQTRSRTFANLSRISH
eukprot:3095459-Prymnesium_polylepis.1